MFGFRRARKRSVANGTKPYRDWYDKWTLLVEGLGFGAVIATIIITLRTNASNDADMTNALGDMANMASAMNNEATATAAQRPFIEQQAQAAADSAAASKATAALAKGQTEAIVQQARALMRSASATVSATQAQIVAASAITATQQPSARLDSVCITGLDTAPVDGSIIVHVAIVFRNTSLVTIVPDRSRIYFDAADEVPDKPNRQQEVNFYRNEIKVPSGGTWTTPKDVVLSCLHRQSKD